MRILLNFGSRDGREARLQTTLTLARGLGADLRCVYAVGPAQLPFAGSERMLSEAEVTEILAAPDSLRLEAQSQFDALTWDCAVETRWEHRPGPVHELVVRLSHYADCAVIEQARPGGLSDRDVFDIVLGCPTGVLVLPRDVGGDHRFETIVLAWNASRESARALHESLPLLSRAREVVVVTADEAPGDTHDADDVSQVLDFLSNHGAAARAVSLEAKPQHMGKALLQAALDQAGELLVMGAFGHSRTFEYWLGGATRDVLQHATLPVFMAH